jgi:hypothetical protein
MAGIYPSAATPLVYLVKIGNLIWRQIVWVATFTNLSDEAPMAVWMMKNAPQPRHECREHLDHL